jgi:hypothetical protein
VSTSSKALDRSAAARRVYEDACRRYDNALRVDDTPAGELAVLHAMVNRAFTAWRDAHDRYMAGE